jgi:hypothetical protein
MPGGSRSLPDRPNLRHLKLEAKRRVAAGEFGSLHDAQVAIAWEYGLSSWTSLKQLVCAQAEQDSHALDQLRWVLSRFAGADEPGWATPGDDELSQHFSEAFLAAIPPPQLISVIGKLTKDLREGELVVLRQTPLRAYVQLADDTITVRELLSHTAGVDSPTELYADAVPELNEFLGPVVACGGPRGTVDPSNGGCAVLGQLVADVTGMPYAQAATQLVLRPLALNDSFFPARSPDIGPRAVTGYSLTLEGVFHPVPARIPTLQAVAGLWSTGADLVRLGLGWSSLLPGALAHEALTPQTGPGPGGGLGARVGLGWIIPPRGDVATHAGANLDATAAVTCRLRDQRTHVVLTSRLMPVNSIETRLLRAWTNPS